MHNGLIQATRMDMLCELRNDSVYRYTGVSIKGDGYQSKGIARLLG